ncbi:uncharacterized protein LOC143224666 isoform X1 [Tachypleus tridentatus]|uniref:uncharacterized protein LOC143224666 isoform X1 n=2 Tax=Tachypleus tridentatus TaxID=6853 RepID=UPI003FD59924
MNTYITSYLRERIDKSVNYNISPWINAATILGRGLFMPIRGRLGDRLGLRWACLFGSVLFRFRSVRPSCHHVPSIRRDLLGIACIFLVNPPIKKNPDINVEENEQKLKIIVIQEDVSEKMKDSASRADVSEKMKDSASHADVSEKMKDSASRADVSEKMKDSASRADGSEKMKDSASRADGSEKMKDRARRADGSEKMKDRARRADGSEKMKDRARRADGSEKMKDRARRADESEKMKDRARRADGSEKMKDRARRADGSEKMKDRARRADGSEKMKDRASRVDGRKELENKENRDAGEDNFSVMLMFKTREFYILTFTMALSFQSILFMIAMTKAYGQTYIKDDFFLSVVTALTGVTNSVSQPIWGLLLDKTSYKDCMASVNALLTAFMLTFYATPYGYKIMFTVWVLAIEFMSAVFVLIPAACAKVYGAKHSGTSVCFVFIFNLPSDTLVTVEDYFSLPSDTLVTVEDYFSLPSDTLVTVEDYFSLPSDTLVTVEDYFSLPSDTLVTVEDYFSLPSDTLSMSCVLGALAIQFIQDSLGGLDLLALFRVLLSWLL